LPEMMIPKQFLQTS